MFDFSQFINGVERGTEKIIIFSLNFKVDIHFLRKCQIFKTKVVDYSIPDVFRKISNWSFLWSLAEIPVEVHIDR